jgi:anti-repressor protein
MNGLTVINHGGQFVVDSREVAEMVGKEHYNLLRDIEGYVQILENSNLRDGATMRVSDFFIPSNYLSANPPRAYKHYLLTRRGCDMVANKMTGEKGVLFTAAYVTKFEEMEKQIAQPQFQVPQTYAEALRLAADQAEQIQEMLPKADFHDTVSATLDDQTIQEVAKVLGTGEKRLFRYLRNRKILMPDNTPYQYYIDQRYFRLVQKVHTYHGRDEESLYTQTLVTGRGLVWLKRYIDDDPKADEILCRAIRPIKSFMVARW